MLSAMQQKIYALYEPWAIAALFHTDGCFDFAHDCYCWCVPK